MRIPFPKKIMVFTTRTIAAANGIGKIGITLARQKIAPKLIHVYTAILVTLGFFATNTTQRVMIGGRALRPITSSTIIEMIPQKMVVFLIAHLTFLWWVQ